MSDRVIRRLDSKKLLDILYQTIPLILFGGTMYFFGTHISKYITANLLGIETNESAVKRVKVMLAKKLGKNEAHISDLNNYEVKLAPDVISGDELGVSFQDIGGMDQEIEVIHDSVVLPIQHWQMLSSHSSILPCPTGVLLYGKPGTGKTMAAKAIAREAGATFMAVKASTILEKWFGESDKLVTAIFSLARKLAPTVIFIDEIDSLLHTRDSGNGTQALQSLQGVFLSEWDGLQTSSLVATAPVIVLGATNRVADIDKAILRRMPVTIQTHLPSETGRIDILKKLLSKETISSDLDLAYVASCTPGFSGSDLRELTRTAALNRVKSILSGKSFQKTSASSGNNGPSISQPTVTQHTMANRPLNAADFDVAINRMRKSRGESEKFSQENLHGQASAVNAADEYEKVLKAVLEASQRL